jgi:hypothetical protein
MKNTKEEWPAKNSKNSEEVQFNGNFHRRVAKILYNRLYNYIKANINFDLEFSKI